MHRMLIKVQVQQMQTSGCKEDTTILTGTDAHKRETGGREREGERERERETEMKRGGEREREKARKKRETLVKRERERKNDA